MSTLVFNNFEEQVHDGIIRSGTFQTDKSAVNPKPDLMLVLGNDRIMSCSCEMKGQFGSVCCGCVGGLMHIITGWWAYRKAMKSGLWFAADWKPCLTWPCLSCLKARPSTMGRTQEEEEKDFNSELQVKWEKYVLTFSGLAGRRLFFRILLCCVLNSTRPFASLSRSTWDTTLVGWPRMLHF